MYRPTQSYIEACKLEKAIDLLVKKAMEQQT